VGTEYPNQAKIQRSFAGIGANTALFTAVDAMVLRGQHYAEDGRVGAVR
jgi:hypothetical protein